MCCFCAQTQQNIPGDLQFVKICVVINRLPELPSDTPETNPILRIKDYPQFKQISADNIVRGCAKVVINHDVAMGIHIDSLPGKCDSYSKWMNIYIYQSELHNTMLTF